MKIESFKIFGYGKWIDQNFNVNSDFHIFYGKNEAGKSTLMSFFHSILFGFPARNSQYLRYEPRESSRYGGQISFSDLRLGKGTIKRVSGKSSGDVSVQLDDGTEGTDELAESLVFGMDKNLYKQLFSFQLRDLEFIYQLKESDINRYFISAGMLGSKEYIRQADWLNQEASKLYKPTGRVPAINKQLKVLNKKHKKLVSAKEKNREYLQLANKISQIESENNEIEKIRLEETKQLSQLQTLEKDWEIKEEIDQLEKELSNNRIPELPDDGMYQLKSLNSQIESIRNKRSKNQKQIDDLKIEHKPSELFLLYKENEDKIYHFENKLTYINNEQNKLTRLRTENNYLKDTIRKDLSTEGLEDLDQLPRIWSKEKAKELKQWENNLSEKESKKESLDKQHEHNSLQIKMIQEDIDHAENNMLSEEEQSTEKSEKTYTPLFFISIGIISLLFFIVTANPVLSTFSLIFSILTFIIGGKTYFNHQTKNHPQNQKNKSEYKNIWRNKLAQMDELVSEQNKVTKNLNILDNEIDLILNKIEQFKENYSLPTHLHLQEIIKKKEKYGELKKDSKQLKKNQEQIKKIEGDITSLMEPIEFIENYFPVQNSIESKLQSYTHFIKKVKEEEKYLDQYIKNTEKIQNHNEQLNKEESNLSDDKLSLLKSAGVHSEETFRELFQKREENRKKENRLNELKKRFKNPNNLKLFSHLDELKSEIQSLNDHKVEMDQKEKLNIEQKAAYKYDIERLEEGSEYTYLLQDYENEKSALQDLLDEWLTKKVASSLIRTTLQKGSKDRLPVVLEDARYFFKYLTNNQYSDIIIDDDEVKVKKNNGNSYKTSELSRGTAEPLYVALRFAFIKNISQTLKLPIIIDDGFVNFDDERKKLMYQLLEEMSEYTQVLYFTFDNEIFNHVMENQVTEL